MKALNIIFYIIIILVIILVIYGVSRTSTKAQEIMDNHGKEKADFESKIAEHEAEAARLEKKIKDQDVKVSDAETKYSTAEAARIEWKAKYFEEKARKPKKKEDITDYDDYLKEYGILELRLIDCETGIEKTEDSLKTCHNLTLELEEQKGNWIKKYANLEAESRDQELELNRREATIHELKEVPTKINFKKAVIYTGIVIGIVLVGIKLLQVIFPK